MASAASLPQTGGVSSAGPYVVIAVAPLEKDCSEIRDHLTPRGISVYQVESLLEALLQSGNVDLIFYDTDVRDHWQTALKVLHRRWPDCPVILVSRLANEHLWIEALAAGVHDVLLKPFLPLELNCVVRGVLRPSHI